MRAAEDQTSPPDAPTEDVDSLALLNRRRRVLFGSMAFLIAAGLAAFGGTSLRGQLEVPDWTDYLGDNERNSLFRALAGDGAPHTDDPVVLVPGFKLLSAHEFRNRVHEGGAFEVRWDEGPTQDHPDALEAVAAHWDSLDLKVVYEGTRVTATRADNNKLYVASVTGLDPEGRALLKLSALLIDPEMEDPSPARGPEEFRSLLPPIPPDSAFHEMGAPGRPGYALMIDLAGTPDTVFAAVRADLLRRGWSPIRSGVAAGPGGAGIEHSEILRHQSAPFGLHLMAKRHTGRVGVSQIYLGLM